MFMMKKVTTQMDPRIDIELYSARNRRETDRAVLVQFDSDARSLPLPMLSQLNWLTPDGKMASAVLDLSRLDELAKLPELEYAQAKRKSLPHGQSLANSSMPAVADRPITAGELLDLLKNQPLDLYRALGMPVTHAQLSFPTDGNGPRLKVSVSSFSSIRPPSEIKFPLGNEVVTIPVQADENFQDFRPH
jgi:hypothetical protein